MSATTSTIPPKRTVKLGSVPRRTIALVAHDNKKIDLLEWARYNRGFLVQHDLVGTGTTGSLIAKDLSVSVECLQSGALGGDQQIGSRIAEGKIDLLLFFWDPLEAQPHDTDVKALLRIAMVWNIPVACNRASADLIVSSSLWRRKYDRFIPDYQRVRSPMDAFVETNLKGDERRRSS